MAKNNFKAKEATDSANYAQDVGTGGQAAMGTGLGQQGQGFGALSDTLGQQKNFASMLQSAAAGTGGPTMADQQIKDATARNNSNAAGFAAGAKGLSPALAARQALMAQSGNNQQAAGQAAQTQVQEQQAARAQLGGALQGQAATGGAMTQAGAGLFGAGGQLANASNANLIGSRNAANTVNADVAKQNAGAINGAIGGVMNAAGAAFGLAEGGVVPGEPEGTQSDETSIALAKGGMVPQARALPSVAPHEPAGPHRSFAAQVAHHLSREYFAEGGMAQHESYKFPSMDLTEKPGKGAQKVPHHTGLDATATGGATSAGPGHEGTDSEGNEKKLKLAEGGDVPEETSFERQLRERQEARERGKEKQTKNDMDSLEKATPKTYSEGGDVEDDSPRPEGDEDDADNEPDTDETSEAPQMFAEGGQLFSSDMSGNNAPPQEGNESAGLSMAAPQPAVDATGAAHKPGMFDALSARVGASPMGKLLGIGTAPDPSAPPAAAAAPAHKKLFSVGGPVPGQANVAGNSLKNDVVSAKLSPGEVVLPRTISHDPEKAKAFVEHLMKHGGSGHDALKDIKKRKA